MLRNSKSSGARRAASAERLAEARAIQSNSTTRFCLYASLINASGDSKMDPAGPRIKPSYPTTAPDSTLTIGWNTVRSKRSCSTLSNSFSTVVPRFQRAITEPPPLSPLRVNHGSSVGPELAAAAAADQAEVIDADLEI